MTLADGLAARPRFVQQLLAVLLLPLALVCIWILIAVPGRWLLTSQSNWRESVRVELARARGEAAALQGVSKRAATFPGAPIWEHLYRADGAPGTVGSAVQQDVMRLCSSAGMQSQSVALLPAERDGPLFRYTVRIAMTGSADRFQAFLTQLRTHARYLRVERLTITAPQSQRPDENAALVVQADIVGFQGERPKAPIVPTT